ncbi:c-type cytochrome [Burkholderia pyrrocinia]|nr:c-type cytochrome [Burkholderia pyrrocinia]
MAVRICAALLGFACTTALPAYAAGGDAIAGQKTFAMCVSCHGANGRDTAASKYPKIGGQNPAYLVAALTAYREGRRTGGDAPIMESMAKQLSNIDIANLAVYISTLGRPG